MKAKHNRSARFRLITLTVCVGIAAVGVSIALISSGAAPARQYAGASGTGAAHRAVSGQPPAAAASGTGTGRSGVAKNMAAKSRWHQLLPERRIRRWQAGPGGTVLAQVQQQMGTAMQAAGMKLYATMRLACVSLASNVYRAQAAPPIPGRAAQRLYAMALTGLSHAASDCRAAISVRSSGEQSRPQVNASLLTRTRAEFAAVALTLNKATGGLPSMIVAG